MIFDLSALGLKLDTLEQQFFVTLSQVPVLVCNCGVNMLPETGESDVMVVNVSLK